MIDWEAQWALHSPGYQDGYLPLKLPSAKQTLRLKAGPGFGDLSHPTTNLVIQLMPPFIKGADVLDIGCGSGILSLAAAALGAASVYGVDIEIDAIVHSQRNAELNNLQVHFALPADYLKEKKPSPTVVLMNMIESEQIIAWNSLKPIHSAVKTAIISGILAKDKEKYLTLVSSWDWSLAKELQEGEWFGGVFLNRSHLLSSKS